MTHLSVVFAYIDPGTGSFVFQMLIAGILSIGLMLTNLRSRVVSLARALFGKGRAEPADTESRPPTA